jgi:hypothetical protein
VQTEIRGWLLRYGLLSAVIDSLLSADYAQLMTGRVILSDLEQTLSDADPEKAGRMRT